MVGRRYQPDARSGSTTVLTASKRDFRDTPETDIITDPVGPVRANSCRKQVQQTAAIFDHLIAESGFRAVQPLLLCDGVRHASRDRANDGVSSTIAATVASGQRYMFRA